MYRRMSDLNPREERTTEQLRLALIELARVDREIDALILRARDRTDLELLRALRACRAALLRVAGVRSDLADDVPEA